MQTNPCGLHRGRLPRAATTKAANRCCRCCQLLRLATPDWAAASTNDRPMETPTVAGTTKAKPKQAASEEITGKQKKKAKEAKENPSGGNQRVQRMKECGKGPHARRSSRVRGGNPHYLRGKTDPKPRPSSANRREMRDMGQYPKPLQYRREQMEGERNWKTTKQKQRGKEESPPRRAQCGHAKQKRGTDITRNDCTQAGCN